MASIELRNLSHSYDVIMGKGEKASFSINNLNVRWEDGKAVALLGPSGCGKTTLLNAISGLLKPKAGQVMFNDRDVTMLSTKQRHIAQVFQFPVVYDSMDVFGNLAFPLLNDGLKKNDIRGRIEEVVEILELQDLLKVSAVRLTPADKQKVSLGRGIIRPDTAAVLLDEPLTVIDPKLQWTLRRKLKQVQRRFRITMVYVTHDQHEALTFADVVTVMSKDGKIAQTGTPEERHENPDTPFVGYFIGSPGMNILDCSLTAEGLDFDGFVMPVSDELRSRVSGPRDGLQLGIRPEFVCSRLEPENGGVPFTALIIEDTGAYKVLTLTRHDIRIKTRISQTEPVSENDTVWVSFPERHVKIFRAGSRIY